MGVYSAYTSFLLRKDCIIFNDSEPTPVQFMLFKYFVDAIITPSSFKNDLGSKHVKVQSYKEFAYLHPNYFAPDTSIFGQLGLNEGEDFALLRFNAFDAVHDFGIRGFSLEQKIALFNKLKEHCHVFISSELELPEELKKHSLNVPKHRIHDVLYYAKMVVADTQTITTEAAVLGTPVVRFNSFTGENDMGNFLELEKKYHLIFNFDDPDKATEKAVNLIKNPDLKSDWSQKRTQLLNDKIDLANFISWFLYNYPESFNEMKRNPDIQHQI
jgi:predicted glycosyltransferase